MNEIAVVTELLDVSTGEVLPATVDNAARVLSAAREMKQRIDGVVREATDYLAAEAIHRGTKTLHADTASVTLSGGLTIDYDPQDLIEALRAAGCPEDRISAAVKETVSYKVDRAVLRQLVGANPDYRAAAELAERNIDKPWRATIK